MRIEFSHFPGALATAEPSVPASFFFDKVEAAEKLRQIEASGFERVIIDDPAGLLSNMDLAAFTARCTSSLGFVLSHWAGAIAPNVAARQLAALDRYSGGRLSLRILPGDGGEDDDLETGRSHVASLERTNEYLVLLKQLWSNEQPFDHEGPFYRVRGGHVPQKGPQAEHIPIRMSGLSGTALKVAGRHADIFELAPGSPQEVGQVIERVKIAAAEFGRASRIRFALPVWLDWTGGEPSFDQRPGHFVRFRRNPANVAVALLPYITLGVSEFIVGGQDTVEAIGRFGREVAPILRNSASRRQPPPNPVWPVAGPRFA
jgi:alkanesulfonate monooxygenase